MANYREHVPLKGSERVVVPGAKAIGATSPDQLLQVTVLLRSRAQAEDAKTGNTRATTGERAAVETLQKQRSEERQHLTREKFLEQRGALEEDIRKVEDFAQEYGLSIVETNLAKGSVKLAGSVASFDRAFDVELLNYEHPGGSYRGRTGPVHIPTELDGIVTAVLGLDNRPQARPHFRTHKPAITARSRDVRRYFRSTLNLTPPKVVAISVDGAHNSPTGDPGGPDGEVMLDIEVAGAVAPKSTLAVYFAPNTDQGFYDAIAAAIHDTRYNPSVISISWGGPESTWSQQSLNEYNTVLEDAATLGVTVCVASGDNGSTDGLTDGLQHVDFPASSPYALACGGTKLTTASGRYASEDVWNETAIQEGRRCGPRHGLRRLCGRAGVRDRRHERRGSALGRAYSTNQRLSRQEDWRSGFTLVLTNRDELWHVSRHYLRGERRILRRARLGCMHGLGLAGRVGNSFSANGEAPSRTLRILHVKVTDTGKNT